jgi:hypothetical protein
MLKPICVSCGTFFKPVKSGIRVLEQMPKIPQAVPGIVAADDWRPYKIWQADLYECRSCGSQVVSGYGLNPIAIQHMPDFKKMLEEHPPDVTVNDC